MIAVPYTPPAERHGRSNHSTPNEFEIGKRHKPIFPTLVSAEKTRLLGAEKTFNLSKFAPCRFCSLFTLQVINAPKRNSPVLSEIIGCRNRLDSASLDSQPCPTRKSSVPMTTFALARSASTGGAMLTLTPLSNCKGVGTRLRCAMPISRCRQGICAGDEKAIGVPAPSRPIRKGAACLRN